MWKSARFGVRLLAIALAGTPNARAIPEVVVACAALSEDERASVEARAFADLAVKGREHGILQLTCAGGTARVTFRSGEFERAGEASLPDQGQARVEALLALVDSVTAAAQPLESEPERPLQSEPEPQPELEPGTVAVPVVVPVPVPVPVPPRPRAAPEPGASPLVDPRADSGRPWHVGAGLEAELWATEVSGAAGLRVRGGRKLAGPLALGVVLSGDLASSEPDQLSVRVWRAGVEAAACADQALCLVLGTQLARLSAEGPADWSPRSHVKTTLGGTLRLDYVVDVGRLQLVLGAGMFLYPARRTVTLNGERVLSVPRLTGSGVLELRWPF